MAGESCITPRSWLHALCVIKKSFSESEHLHWNGLLWYIDTAASFVLSSYFILDRV
jgi:hypothetical protein